MVTDEHDLPDEDIPESEQPDDLSFDDEEFVLDVEDDDGDMFADLEGDEPAGLDVQDLLSFGEDDEDAATGLDDLEFVIDEDGDLDGETLFNDLDESDDQDASGFDADEMVLVDESDDYESVPHETIEEEVNDQLDIVFGEHDVTNADEFDSQLEAVFGGQDESSAEPFDLGTPVEAHMSESGESWSAIDEEEDSFTLVDEESTAASFLPSLDPVIRPADEAVGDDPIYGDRSEELSLTDHPDSGPSESLEFKHLETMMREAELEAAVPVVVGGAPLGRTWMKRMMVASMAACVLILGVVAFVTLRPDLPMAQDIRGFLGLDSTTGSIVEVVRSQRPRIETDLPVPGIEISEEMRLALAKADPALAPTLAQTPTKSLSDRVKRRLHRLVDTLKWLGKGAGRVAVTMLPKKGKQPRGGDPTAKTPDNPRPDTVEPEPSGPIEPTRRLPRGVLAMTDFSSGIVRGARAFAQLHNGNFFVGRVQKVMTDELVIEFGNNSEISFVPGDLQKLMPLAEAEERVLQSGPDGYVHLKNHNKIWGKILSDLPDVVAIQAGSAHIVLPRTSVLGIDPKEKRRGVELGKDEQDWGDEHLPKVELQAVPSVEEAGEEELLSGAVRVKISGRSGAPQDNHENLRQVIRKRLPHVLPGRK